MIDHRASPGIPENVARANGMDPGQVGSGKLMEAATLTCSHCKVAVLKNPLRVRERHACVKCGYHYICDFCAMQAALPDYSHTPFEKVADDAMKGITMGSPRGLLDSIN